MLKFRFAAALALAASLITAPFMAMAQTQPVPGAIGTNGQSLDVIPSALMVAPAGGGPGRGKVVAPDAPLPTYCVVYLGSSCGSGGGGGGSASYTAATAPFSVTAGVNKPAGISSFSSAQWFIPVKPGTTTEVDLSAPASLMGLDGATIMTAANPLTAQLTAGAAIIGKTSQVDSGGADATDTTNHAIKVNVVAGSSSGAVAQGSITAGQSGLLGLCATLTAAPTNTTATSSALSCDPAGNLRVVLASSSTGFVAQGSTTAGQLGPLMQGAVTTAVVAPTTATTAPISLTGNSALRTWMSANGFDIPFTQGNSGTFTLNAGSQVLPLFSNTPMVIGNTGGVASRQLDASLTTSAVAGGGVVLTVIAPTSGLNGGAAIGAASTATGVAWKATAGNLYGYNFTQGASAGFLAFVNATTVPTSGATITPVFCIPVAANAYIDKRQTIADRFSSGIVALSTSSCTTYTPVSQVTMNAVFE